MTLEHRHLQERLDHFLDGELSDEERLEVEEHLVRCDRCLQEVEALRGLRIEAHSLPREIAPPRDLWPGIAARIQGGASAAHGPDGVIEVDFAERRPRAPGRVWVIRIAAALALVVGSSAATALLLRGPGTAPIATLPVRQVTPETNAALVAFAATEAEYRGTVEALAAELEARKGELSPATIATVEQNLRIIDQAIAESKAALRAEPSDPEIPLLLSGVYRKKVELLQSAVQLAAS